MMISFFIVVIKMIDIAAMIVDMIIIMRRVRVLIGAIITIAVCCGLLILVISSWRLRYLLILPWSQILNIIFVHRIFKSAPSTCASNWLNLYLSWWPFKIRHVLIVLHKLFAWKIAALFTSRPTSYVIIVDRMSSTSLQVLLLHLLLLLLEVLLATLRF